MHSEEDEAISEMPKTKVPRGLAILAIAAAAWFVVAIAVLLGYLALTYWL